MELMMYEPDTVIPKSAWFQQGVMIRQPRPDIVTCMERDKQDRHETPSGVQYNDPTSRRFEGSLNDTKSLYGAHHVPEDEFEALMVCSPFQEPKMSKAAADTIGEALERILDGLSDRERSTIELVVFGGMSLAEAGKYLGAEFGRERPYSKAMVAKYRDQALVKLRERYMA